MKVLSPSRKDSLMCLMKEIEEYGIGLYRTSSYPFAIDYGFLKYVGRYGQPHHLHRIPPDGRLKLPGAPNLARFDILGTLAGNLVTLTIIVIDLHLHFPMYLFIGNLSLTDLGYISVTVPKSITNYFMGQEMISLGASAAQIFLYIFFGSAEFFLLVVMSYDRYVAICHPLHYGSTVSPRFCTQASCGSWASGLVYSAVHTGTMFSHPFTKSNVTHQFFCDIPQIMSISSQAVQFSAFVALAVSACIVLLGFVILFASYVHIFSTMLHMHSVEAQNKALSTCSSQIPTLTLFVISGLFACFGHVSNSPSIQTLLTVMFYFVVSPLVNPIIFILRNRMINSAVHRMLKKAFQFHRIDFIS